MSRIMLAAATSQTIYLEILDSTSTTGGRKTGLAFNTSSLTGYYALVGAAAVQITLVTQTVTGAYSSGGFVEVDATNMPGIYRLDLPNAAIASGPGVIITLKGATGMVQVSEEIQLTAFNLQTATQKVDVDTIKTNPVVNAGTVTFPTGATLASTTNLTAGTVATVTNRVTANTDQLNGTALTGRDIGASVLLSAGTGTGQLDFTSGVVKANLAQILGTALTETAGQIAAAFKQFFDVASPTGTMKAITNVVTTTNLTTYTGNTPQTGDAYARLGAPAGASVSADVAAVKVDTAAVKAQTDKFVFTVANQVDSNVIDWKGATAPAMTGDAFARLGAPAGASVSADVAAVKTDTAAIKLKTDNLPGSPAAVGSAMTLTSGERTSIADAMLDETAGVETGLTVRQHLRLATSALFSKLSGAATSTVVIRDFGDTKNRITATVDADGNRSAITTDAT